MFQVSPRLKRTEHLPEMTIGAKAELPPPPEPKPEPKPQPKAEPKPQPKPEPKPVPKLEPKLEPKVESIPEPKKCPKPIPKVCQPKEPKKMIQSTYILIRNYQLLHQSVSCCFIYLDRKTN